MAILKRGDAQMKFDNRVQRCKHLFTKADKEIVNYIKNNQFDDNFSTIN